MKELLIDEPVEVKISLSLTATAFSNFYLSDQEQEGVGEDHQEYHKDFH